MPAFVSAERDALLTEIEQTFAGVDRKGGVSWGESRVIDDYGTEKERAAARAKDAEGSWQGLLGTGWTPESGVGGFSFLDAIGFRYYLPAAMVLSVREGRDVGILFHLTLPKEDSGWGLKKWSLLSPSQRRCVKRYLEYMYVLALPSAFEAERYLQAVEGHWGKEIEADDPPKVKKAAPGFKRKKRTEP